VTAESRCHILPFGRLADVGKAVIGFDDLPRPPMRHGNLRQQELQPLLETTEALHCLFHLTGLVIFAAEDDEIVVLPSIDTHVVVRIAGIPEEPFVHRAARHPAADDVRAVRRQLRLKDGRGQQSRLPLQRHVRRDEHMLAMYSRAAGGRGSDRCPFDVVDIRLLEDLAAFSGGEEPQ